MVTNVNPQQIWKNCHWLFFINVQGLIICLRRFELSLATNNMAQAQIELETATTLMLSSGAAMELAGSFSPQEYEHQVRPTMSPPHVESHDFSGLMSWEHASLIEIWKRLRPIFEALPEALASHHDRYVAAYFSLCDAHKAVCQKFGGGEMGSLRCDRSTATSTLDKFTQSRWQLLDPNHRASTGCPFQN